MNITQKQFRLLLVLSIASMIAAVIVSFGSPGYSAELADAYENEPESLIVQHLWLLLGIFIPLTIAGIAGLIGLYRFKSWGRTLSLYSTIIGLVMTPLLGPSLSSGLVSSLEEVSSLLSGAILALAYYSSVSSFFNANHVPQATSEDAPS